MPIFSDRGRRLGKKHAVIFVLSRHPTRKIIVRKKKRTELGMGWERKRQKLKGNKIGSQEPREEQKERLLKALWLEAGVV